MSPSRPNGVVNFFVVNAYRVVSEFVVISGKLFREHWSTFSLTFTQVIEDCELMRRSLTDFAAIDAEIARQLEETEVVAELVKAAVKENASTAQSQEMDYLQQQSIIQGSSKIVLPFSKKELADYLGVQRPSLFRELKKMKDEGIIEIDNRTIQL